MSEANTKLDFALHLDFEAILTNPILDIAAHVWEAERYEAFKVCYRSMRLIDDLVDQRKSSGTAIAPEEVAQMSALMREWLAAVKRGRELDTFQREFVATLDRFGLPLWPWERLATAMIYDLTHEGFRSFLAFARYTEGAAIAPAAIFMHLCGVREIDGAYEPPPYDIRRAARPLAMFSYLVHIMRDYEKDQRAGLDYFADDILARHGLTKAELREIAQTGRIPRAFRELMADYVAIAEYYRAKARAVVDEIEPLLEPRYQLSLELIYQLYLQIYQRIDPWRGRFTAEALNPSPSEVHQLIQRTISKFDPAGHIR